MKDTVSLQNLHTSLFDEESQKEAFIKDQLDFCKQIDYVDQILINSEDAKLVFCEIPLYTSHPEAIYVSTRHPINDLNEPIIVIFSIKAKPLSMIGSPDEPKPDICMSNACVTVIYPKGIKDSIDPSDHYDYAQDITNQYILSYKLIPGRHHHDLRLKNITNSGPLGIVDIYGFEYGKPLALVGSQGLLLNSGFVNYISNQMPLNEYESAVLAKNAQNDNDAWEILRAPLYKVISSFDFNCYGDADIAITIASSGTEGFIMMTQVAIRVVVDKEAFNDVYNEIKTNSLRDLSEYLKNRVGLNTDNSSRRTAYGKWYIDCYTKRNSYLHRQEGFGPPVSRPAIDSSLNLIRSISRRVASRYRNTDELTRYIDDLMTSLLIRPADTTDSEEA